MNWKEIRDSYPKAFELFCNTKMVNTLHIDYKLKLLKHQLKSRDFDLRDLYDFFDNVKPIVIMVEIEVSFYDACFYFEPIIQVGNGDFHDIDVFDKRNEAEIAGFTKAFEILEQKLSNE